MRRCANPGGRNVFSQGRVIVDEGYLLGTAGQYRSRAAAVIDLEADFWHSHIATPSPNRVNDMGGIIDFLQRQE